MFIKSSGFLYSLIYSILYCRKTSGLFKLTACGLIWNSLLSSRGEQIIKGNENCLISLLWQQIHLFVMFCFVTFHLLRIKIVSDYFWVSNFCATPTEMTGSNWVKDRSSDSSLTLWKCLFWAVKKSSSFIESTENLQNRRMFRKNVSWSVLRWFDIELLSGLANFRSSFQHLSLPNI